MKDLLAEKESALKKGDILAKKYKSVSVSLQGARAMVREANSKKRKAKACLKSSLGVAQSNLSKVQEKSTAAINCLEKQNQDKSSQCKNSCIYDPSRQKVRSLVSFSLLLWLCFDLLVIFLICRQKVKRERTQQSQSTRKKSVATLQTNC